MSRVVVRQGAGGVLCLLLLGVLSCGGGGTIGPANQPQVRNSVDDFQFQASNLSHVTQTIQYIWQNTGTLADVNQAAAVTGGTASLRIRDAGGAQVYSNSLTANGTAVTQAGATGNWTIEVTLNDLSGAINFRVQKH